MLPQLDQVFYPKVSLEANPDHDEKKPIHVVPEIKLELVFNSDESMFAIARLTFEDAPKNNLTHSIELEAFAFFSFQEKLKFRPAPQPHLDPDFAGSLRTTVIGMIIGGMRDFLSTLTSRTPWGNFVLPSIAINNVPTEFYFDRDIRPGDKAVRKRASKKAKASPSPRKRAG